MTETRRTNVVLNQFSSHKSEQHEKNQQKSFQHNITLQLSDYIASLAHGSLLFLSLTFFVWFLSDKTKIKH